MVKRLKNSGLSPSVTRDLLVSQIDQVILIIILSKVIVVLSDLSKM